MKAHLTERGVNAVDFGGFPHMPGTVFAMSYSKQGARNDDGKIT